MCSRFININKELSSLLKSYNNTWSVYIYIEQGSGADNPHAVGCGHLILVFQTRLEFGRSGKKN